MTNAEIKNVITLAILEAATATQKMINENPGQWWPCGFSWVVIKPARGPFVKLLKEMGLGRTSDLGGFMVYNPSGNSTQWMDAKMAGSRAFVKVLQANGVKCYAEERMD